MGLRPREITSPPSAAGVGALGREGELLRRRIASEPRLRAAMAWGRRSRAEGELQRRAERALRERPAARERQPQLAASGSRLGTTRADAFRARREWQSNALGYQDFEDFYRRRYRYQRARLVELAAELGCAESVVRGDLDRLRLGPDRARFQRRALALGAVVVPAAG